MTLFTQSTKILYARLSEVREEHAGMSLMMGEGIVQNLEFLILIHSLL